LKEGFRHHFANHFRLNAIAQLRVKLSFHKANPHHIRIFLKIPHSSPHLSDSLVAAHFTQFCEQI